MTTPQPAARVLLLPGRDKAAREGHPWIFSGAVGRLDGNPAAGDVVRVDDSRGDFVGWGHYSPASRIRVRLLDRREDAVVNEGWWSQRLSAAIGRRREQLLDPRGACEVQVDGGGRAETAEAIGRRGTDVIVVGSALYRAPDMTREVARIRSIADAARATSLER
jgi:hypothetical protein